jgi:hypothetical protein
MILAPPLQDKLTPLTEISWSKTIIPELLWIALIHNHCGLREGVELITWFTRTARHCVESEKNCVFSTVSSFGNLDNREQSSIVDQLSHDGNLASIREAVLPLVALYPECPLKLLYSGDQVTLRSQQRDLEVLKAVVGGMYDKTERAAVMVQATAVWIAFDSGVLKVKKGLALADFPEIEYYPHTEKSQEIAASIRSAVRMLLIDPFYPSVASWPDYFWNRGLEISDCYFTEAPHE